MRNRSSLSSLVLLAVLAFTGACGGSTAHRVSSPMSARDTEVFDNAVDYVTNPADLGSSWGPASEADMQHRVAAADLVAIVLVRAVRSDVDNTTRRTRRLSLDVENALVGSHRGELILSVSELEAGFDTVDTHDAQLLERRFVAFVKWARSDEDAHLVVPRWHLAPASDTITADVRRLVRQRQSGTSGN